MRTVNQNVNLTFICHVLKRSVLDALSFTLCPRVAHKAPKVSRSRLYCKIFTLIFFALLHEIFISMYNCNNFYILTNVICQIRNSVLRLQSIYAINDLSYLNLTYLILTFPVKRCYLSALSHDSAFNLCIVWVTMPSWCNGHKHFKLKLFDAT